MMANSNGDVGQAVEALIPEPALLEGNTGMISGDGVIEDPMSGKRNLTTEKVRVADNLKPQAYSDPEGQFPTQREGASIHAYPGNMDTEIEPRTVPGRDAVPTVLNPASLPVIETGERPLQSTPPIA